MRSSPEPPSLSTELQRRKRRRGGSPRLSNPCLHPQTEIYVYESACENIYRLKNFLHTYKKRCRSCSALKKRTEYIAVCACCLFVPLRTQALFYFSLDQERKKAGGVSKTWMCYKPKDFKSSCCKERGRNMVFSILGSERPANSLDA